MNRLRFKKELETVIPLVLSYAADYYNLQQYESPEEALKKIGRTKFLNKCHKGFKIAQDRIVNGLLEIERESKPYKKKLKELKNKQKLSEIRKQKPFKDITKKIKQLKFQKAVFEELANVIVWTIFKMERIEIKSFMQPDMHHKSLLEGNIKSLIETAQYYNRDRNKFALITDITSCISMGDLIILDTEKNTLALVEVKEGKVNDLILETLRNKDLSIAEKHLFNLQDNKSRKKFLMQFKRVLEQHEKSSSALAYPKSGTGKDLFTGLTKKIIETNIVEDQFVPALFEALQKLYTKSKKSEIYFSFDSGLVAVIREPTIARKWDFQHFIQHTILESKSDCPYTKYKPVAAALETSVVRNHFKKLQAIPLYNPRNKVFSPTHVPIFFNLPQKQAVDLLTDALGIYIYFDPERFFDLCQKNGLQPSWSDYEAVIQGESKYVRSSIFRLGNKSLTFLVKKKQFQFTYGFLFRIVYEFQTADSVIKQLKAFR